MRKSAVEQWTAKAQKRARMTHLSGVDDIIKLMLSDEDDMGKRHINPTQRAFILDPVRYKAYMGPAGCAKTTTGVVDIMLKALLLPGTKYFIARKNYNDLIDTTLRTATEVLQRLPEGTLIDRSKAPPQKWYIKPMAVIGQEDKTPSEITFMGLTDNVGSYEFNGGFIDEADEVEEHYVQQLKGRLRYKPWPGYPDENYQIGLAFNPPSVAHWLHLACTGMDEAGNQLEGKQWLKLFRPEPRENQRNLPKGYYESMTATLPEDLRQRLVDGAWGSTFPGEPVVRQFKRSIHVREGLQFGGGTLFRFEDFGYRYPGVLFCQISKRGHLHVLKEFQGSSIEATKFAEDIIRMTNESFPRATKYEDVGDPAVAQTKDTGQTLAVLNKAGILVRYQRTPFELSMNLLRKRFETLIEGEPAILIDPSCRMLIDGLAGGYHFKSDGVTPHKGLYDHLIDALRYGVYFYFGSSLTSTTGLPTSLAYWSKDGT